MTVETGLRSRWRRARSSHVFADHATGARKSTSVERNALLETRPMQGWPVAALGHESEQGGYLGKLAARPGQASCVPLEKESRVHLGPEALAGWNCS